MNDQERTQLKKIAQKVNEGALKRGAKGVRVVASRSRRATTVYRDGRADRVQQSARKGLSVHLYLDGKYTQCRTNDLREPALERFLDGAMAMCRAMAPDKFRRMPDPALYEGQDPCDLALFDPAVGQITPEDRNRYAAALEHNTLEAAGETAISAEASFTDSQGEFYQIHSNGFEGSSRGTRVWASAEVTLQDEGDKRPAGWAEAGSRRHHALPEPETTGRKAAEVARARLLATKIPTARLPMIVENRVAGRLLGQVVQAASGRALQQKTSFLEGFRGKRFGSEQLDLVDDPLLVGGFGSRRFDGEGIAARPRAIFDQGVLADYFLNTYYARKLNLPPTTGGPSNLILTPGTKSLDQLVADISRGVLVRGFLGGNGNGEKKNK